MYFLNDFTKYILSRYRTHLELIDTIPIGFTGVVSQRPAPVFTNEISEDVLLWGATVDLNNAAALVRIKSVSPQYDWMANDDPNPQDTPINAIAGIFSQAMPILPLVMPFFIKKQGRLQMQFTNSPTSPSSGGVWTWRGLRLTDPIDGQGWDYSLGFGN